ncbi:hypothetical protein RUM43_000414, partial [Polyplax serrata]
KEQTVVVRAEPGEAATKKTAEQVTCKRKGLLAGRLSVDNINKEENKGNPGGGTEVTEPSVVLPECQVLSSTLTFCKTGVSSSRREPEEQNKPGPR